MMPPRSAWSRAMARWGRCPSGCARTRASMKRASHDPERPEIRSALRHSGADRDAAAPLADELPRFHELPFGLLRPALLACRETKKKVQAHPARGPPPPNPPPHPADREAGDGDRAGHPADREAGD